MIRRLFIDMCVWDGWTKWFEEDVRSAYNEESLFVMVAVLMRVKGQGLDPTKAP